MLERQLSVLQGPRFLHLVLTQTSSLVFGSFTMRWPSVQSLKGGGGAVGVVIGGWVTGAVWPLQLHANCIRREEGAAGRGRPRPSKTK